MGAEITAIKEDTEKQLQEAEMVLELEKQKLLKVFYLTLLISIKIFQILLLRSYREGRRKL